MSNHEGPEFIAPQEIRCEALVRGHKSWAFTWAKVDHQCPRKSNQMIGIHQVCWQHARMEVVTYVSHDSTFQPADS